MPGFFYVHGWTVCRERQDAEAAMVATARELKNGIMDEDSLGSGLAHDVAQNLEGLSILETTRP